MTNTDINPDRPLRGRRLSWREFTVLTGRPKPDYATIAANDNEEGGPASSQRVTASMNNSPNFVSWNSSVVRKPV